MPQLRHDLRFAVRFLARRRATALLAVLALALGIGAATRVDPATALRAWILVARRSATGRALLTECAGLGRRVVAQPPQNCGNACRARV